MYFKIELAGPKVHPGLATFAASGPGSHWTDAVDSVATIRGALARIVSGAVSAAAMGCEGIASIAEIRGKCGVRFQLWYCS